MQSTMAGGRDDDDRKKNKKSPHTILQCDGLPLKFVKKMKMKGFSHRIILQSLPILGVLGLSNPDITSFITLDDQLAR